MALPSPPAGNLEARERAVLEELARDANARVAFQGLKRRLDLHQQKLARALRRLERRGLVDRDAQGYRLTPRGALAVEGAAGHAPPSAFETLVEAALPYQLGPRAVVNHLSNRWFQGLRWYALSDHEGGTVLTWMTEPGRVPIRVRLEDDRVRLELPVDAAQDAATLRTARGVLSALAELYGLVPEPDAATAASSWRFASAA